MKSFQKDHGLRITGEARPDDETIQTLNKESNKMPEGYYIWRTVEDDKVRAAHAQYSRTVRAWSDSPDPGEDYNCRCWAEPVDQVVGLIQEVISPVDDQNKWDWANFVEHYYRGNGRTVSLAEIGLLSGVIDHAKSVIFSRVEKQIEEKIKSMSSGSFSDTFLRSYDFGSVSFSLGNSTVSGSIKGNVKKQEKILIVDAQIEYLFFDQFTDPLSIRQNKTGTSAADKADPYTEAGGIAYDIVDRWLTEVTGTVSDKE